MDSAELISHRVRVSTKNFVFLARLDNVPAIPDAKIELVTIPQVILSVVMRDTSLDETDLTHIPFDVDSEPSPLEARMSKNCHSSGEGETNNNDHGERVSDDELLEIMDSDEEALIDAHRKLGSESGIVDLTGNI
ncbi:hypothetical protein B0H13DRAFT_2390818 [Mycena leptocephala]|nr:hypothetical protein B0H13DRAFT_2390818 [Mycena leptocephala]